MKKNPSKKFLLYFISICVFLLFVFLGLWPGAGNTKKDIWDEMERWRRKHLS